MATEVIHSIKADGSGDYTDLFSWEAAQTRDLVVLNEIAVAEIYGNISESGLNLSGAWGTSAVNNIVIRSATNQEFNPTTKIGASLTCTNTGSIISTSGASIYVDIISLGLTAPSGTAVKGSNLGKGVKVKKCNIYDVVQANPQVNSSVLYENCLYEITQINSNWLSVVFLYNCTVIAKAGFGPLNGLVLNTCTSVNTAVFNENPKVTYNNYFNGSQTNCAQNNNGSTALNTANGNINGILTTDFTDYANGDYSVAQTVYDVDGVTVLSKSQLLDAGTDLSAQYITDIVGTVRG